MTPDDDYGSESLSDVRPSHRKRIHFSAPEQLRSLRPDVKQSAVTSMDQMPIGVFLYLKERPANVKDVRTECLHVLGSDAIVYPTVIKYLRNDIILQNEPEAEVGAEDQSFSIADNAVLDALEMMSLASIRQIAKMTIILPTTLFRRLTKSFHFVSLRFTSF
jgi:hypothetical protein